MALTAENIAEKAFNRADQSALLRDMPPILFPNNPQNSTSRHSVFFGDLISGGYALYVFLSDLFYLLIGQLGPVMAFAMRHFLWIGARIVPIPSRYPFRVSATTVSFSPCDHFRMNPCAITVAFGLPAFFNHVCGIFSRSTKKQVRGINAKRVVAVVANKKRTGIFLVVNEESEPVRSSIPTKSPEHAVSSVFDAYPDPALFLSRFLNLRPKPINLLAAKIGNGRVLISHLVSLLQRFRIWLGPSIASHRYGGSFILPHNPRLCRLGSTNISGGGYGVNC